MHTTHNTGECHKYEKDGTLKKGFSGKAAIGQTCNGYNKKENANSFVQFMDHFLQLEKTAKRPRKAHERSNITTKIVTLVIPTRNRIAGMVVL